MDLIIRWKVGTLSLPRTPKSDLIEKDVDNEQKKNGLIPPFSKETKVQAFSAQEVSET
jgi:hypothetical protein